MFLGAGASVQFGNLATKEIKEQVEQITEERLKPLLRLKSFPDLEYFLTFLKQLQDLEYTPLGQFFKNDEFEIEVKSEPLTKMQFLMTMATTQFNQIMSYLFHTYKIKEERISDLKEFYSNLFKIIEKYSNPIAVGTTNYDLAIETFCNVGNSDYSYIDGFEMISHRSRFNPPIFDKPDVSKKIIRLYKIHGSLNWVGNPPHVEKQDRIGFQVWGGDSPSIIIPPTLSPKDEVEPFSTLLQRYSEELLNSDVCVVIGFSFRDEHISKYFRKFMDEGKRLIIISPNCRRDYAINLVRGKDNRSTESEINEYADAHSISENRKINFIPLSCEVKNNKEILTRLENILSKIFD